MRLMLRTTLAASLFVATTANAQSAAPDIRHREIGGEHWLIACIPDEAVDRFVTAGFVFGGAPAIILCMDGYTAMYKHLGH